MSLDNFLKKEDIFHKISKDLGISYEKFVELVDRKVEELGGMIFRETAARLIVTEKGLDPSKYIRQNRGDNPFPQSKIWVTHYPGGLFHIVKDILRFIPQHKTYVEVFGGMGVVLLNKPKSSLEVFNDIDGNITNLFKVLRDNFKEFREKAQWLIYSVPIHNEYLQQYNKDRLQSLSPIDRAVAYFYLLTTSTNAIIGSRFSIEKRGTFENALKRLKHVHRRLQKVLIENLDFRKCIEKYDSQQTFFFLDPPHLLEKGGEIYEFTFSLKDHYELSKMLRKIKGKYLLVHIENKRMYEFYGDLPVIGEIEKRKHMEVKTNQRQTQKYILFGNYNPPKSFLKRYEIRDENGKFK